MVVIAIIAVLAGLLLPVVSSVTTKAKAVETKAMAVQIVTAVKNYQVEYGQYPNPVAAGGAPGASGVDTTYDISTGNAELFKVLQAINTAVDPNSTTGALAYNNRHVKYFEARTAKNPTAPRSGFVPTGGNLSGGNPAPGSQTRTVAVGDLVDSWGNRYCIRMDAGYNESIYNPYSPAGTSVNADDAAATDPTQVLRFGAIAYTYGPDGQYGKAGTASTTSTGDDVLSWQ